MSTGGPRGSVPGAGAVAGTAAEVPGTAAEVPGTAAEVPGTAADVPVYCGQCGGRLDEPPHDRCRQRAALEPPRYCAHCRRRIVVQVTPTGWWARCVQHGVISANGEHPS